MRVTALALIVYLLGTAGPAFAQAPVSPDTAQALDREVRRIASELELWPGFEPTTVPLAVFDGETTHLFRHPAPPEEFAPAGEAGAPESIHAGRHPSITANSYVDIGGATTATLLLNGPMRTADLARLAAVALHEAFHVFQRQRHADWQPNEAELFVYPIEDARLLTLRRLETAALERALGASEETEVACWASRALDLRRQRVEALDEPFVAYERNSELWEGLANYVQGRAEGRGRVEFPAGGFPAPDVRQRAYATGAALAVLLDRLHPDWRIAVDTQAIPSLHAALEAALQGREVAVCDFEPADRTRASQTVERDIEALLSAQSERRDQFDRLDGWRVTVEAADGQPLWPEGFDPMNVQRLEGKVLHTRYLKLGNDAGSLEMIDTAAADLEALTEGAGPHPLFNGVQRAAIAGLAKPEIERTAHSVLVRAQGLKADLTGAQVSWGERELVVRLRPVD